MGNDETYRISGQIEMGDNRTSPVETRNHLTAEQLMAYKADIREQAPAGSVVNLEIERDS